MKKVVTKEGIELIEFYKREVLLTLYYLSVIPFQVLP
jgi:hypothetical protein